MQSSGNNLQARQAFSLVELVLVMVIIILITGFASLPVVRIIERSRIESDVDKFDVFLKQCVQHAVMKSSNVQVYLDLDNGIFEAYEIYKPLDFGSESNTDEQDIAKITEITEKNKTAEPDTDIEVETEIKDDRKTELLFECEPMQLNYLDYVITEDGQQYSSGEIYLEADAGGWIESFVVTITDEMGNYSSWLRCDRFTATVREYNRETELPQPVSDF